MIAPLKRVALAVAAVACAGLVAAYADENGRSEHKHMSESSDYRPVEIPQTAENFRLLDHQGKSHELYYYQDAPAIVIMTQGNGCPIVRNAVPDFRAIRDAYADRGVEFYLLNSNLQDNRETVAAEAAEYGFDVPVLIDEQQLIGEALGVTRTAEVFVIDPAKGFEIVFHGPINDRQGYERQKAKASKTYLRDTLDQMLAGEAVTVEAPPRIPGCIVNFPERQKRADHASISYAHDIAPILMSKCVECHQPGGIGPFAMTSHEVVSGWAPMMREVIRTRRMPPWHADPHIGTWEGDRSLDPEQKKTLVHWIEAGAPRGEGPDPLARASLQAEDWGALGPPDLILELPAQTVPESGIVDYTYPVVLNPLKEDKWLRATAFKVGSRETVHHILSGYMSEVPADGFGSPQLWEFSTGGYAVGAEALVHGDNVGVPLPAGGAIGFQLHYTPIGKEVTDKTLMGLYFHDKKPKYVNRTEVILDGTIALPPGEARHEETAYLEFPYDAELISAFPHAHYRGHASKLTLRTPDGNERLLLSLPKYDFNWQRMYEFTEPVDIPAGSKLIAHYVYDNSARNFANPDPEKRVTWGDQSHEEMLYTSLTFRWKGETTDDLWNEREEELTQGRMFRMWDDNVDDRVSKEEMKGQFAERLKPFFDRLDSDRDGLLSMAEYRVAIDFMRQQQQAQRQQQSGGR